MTCVACGAAWPAEMRFCGSCGAALAAPAPVAGVRKTVTAVFCDVTGSTALGQRLDPEALRGLMEAHFATVSAALVRHGGTVEKFVGDAVMAVFGVPVAHEDDALRACRAALEVLSAVADVDRGVDAAQPVPLEVRVGVETGEVVVGDPGRGSTFASGAAVNLAARLEQAAEPGECLIGPGCYRLVRDLVEVEVKDGLSLKGFPDTVTAYRLRAVNEQDRSVTDRPVAPLVGRARELALLRSGVRAGGHRPDVSAGDGARAGRGGQVAAGGGVPGRSGRRRCRCATVLRGAACPTGRASRTGRWWRWCARRPG